MRRNATFLVSIRNYTPAIVEEMAKVTYLMHRTREERLVLLLNHFMRTEVLLGPR